MSNDWRFELSEVSGETLLTVGSEQDDIFLAVSWTQPIDGKSALCILNNLTQALDKKLTGSCANERIMEVYKKLPTAHVSASDWHGE